MLDSFVHIRKKLSVSSLTDSEIIGSIRLSTDDISHLNELAKNHCIEDFVKINGLNIPTHELKGKEEITEIRLYPQQLSGGYFFENGHSLVSRFSQKLPEHPYFIHSLNYFSSKEEKTDFIINYETTIQFIDLLKSLSDYQKVITPYCELVFFQAKKLVLTTKYDADDIQKLNKFNNLQGQLSTTHDKEERQTIFVNELINVLTEIKEEHARFPHLLKSFSEVFEKYIKSHQFYLQQFSFQKIKSELDNEKIEYAKKLQGVINDAQTKLVAIPIAFLLIISQFDLTGEQIYLNVALILSAIVFSVLLEVLIRNQYSSLDFITEDIQRFKNEFQEKKSVLPTEEFDRIFNKIGTLQSKQKCYLNIIRTLVWLTPVFAGILFLISLINNPAVCILSFF